MDSGGEGIQSADSGDIQDSGTPDSVDGESEDSQDDDDKDDDDEDDQDNLKNTQPDWSKGTWWRPLYSGKTKKIKKKNKCKWGLGKDGKCNKK